MRAAALTAAAKLSPDAFLLVLSGLNRDPEWSVRATLANVLGTFGSERVTPALEELLADEDARVHGPALEALAAVKVPEPHRPSCSSRSRRPTSWSARRRPA